MEEDGTTTSRVRIFVGGLGEGVTAEDLLRLFGSLGSLDGVDIIRTKGRSFAYVDFIPSPSDNKSLSKLFSKYNGCLWKGGKLRLERAKEHYLVRLKQEWAKDAELVSDKSGTSLEPNTSVFSGELPAKESSKTNQLRIFFPRLKKVKLIPFSGTGKHKYSFQNVEVPPLPVHFCDCEEHSSPSGTVRGKQCYDGEAENVGMNDEEMNIMNAVMNKLFEREKMSNSMHDEKEQKSLESPDGLQSDEVDSETDEDDLIINMETNKKKTASIGSQELETLLKYQESGLNETIISDEEANKNMLQVKKRNNITPNKNRKSLLDLERENNGYVSATPGGKTNLQTHLGEQRLTDGVGESTKVSWSQKSSWRELLGAGGSSAFNASHILPEFNSSEEEQLGSDGSHAPESSNNITEHLEMDEDQANKPTETQVIEGIAEAQPTNKNLASNNSGRGTAWLQKQSWTQLVAENDNSFSISQLLPAIAFQKSVAKEPIVDSTISNYYKDDGLTENTNNESVSDGFDLANSIPEKNQNVGVNDIASAPIIEKKCETAPKETYTADVKVGGTCSFMRSAASLREWAKTKAALNRPLKRKRSEK